MQQPIALAFGTVDQALQEIFHRRLQSSLSHMGCELRRIKVRVARQVSADLIVKPF